MAAWIIPCTWEISNKILAIAYPSYPNHSFSPMMGMEFPFQVTFPGSDWCIDLSNYTIYLWRSAILSGAKMELKQKSCYDDTDRDGDYSCIYL